MRKRAQSCPVPEMIAALRQLQLHIVAVCTRLDVQPNEIFYLGDSDNDMREAVNNSVIFFLTAWSNPDYPYGIPVATPQLFVQIVETFFLKEHLW